MRGCLNDSALERLAAARNGEGALPEHVVNCAACRARLEARRNELLAERVQRLDAPGLWSTASVAPLCSAALSDAGSGSRSEASVLPVIEGFRIIRLIGTGGMGSIFEAEQESPRRSVALKMLRAGWAAGEERVRLFRREADALARLSHPGIAVVFSTGVAGSGEPFLVMELVRGELLNAYVSRHRGCADEILRVMALICRAVDHAHGHGVIHRDLKPSNIMVDGGGSPKVLDFGLAHVAGDRVCEATLDGRFAGTLAYMSPEQVSGRCGVVDTRTDVYALGVILYQLLTGEVPIDVERRVGDVVEAIRSEPARSLRRYRPELSAELDRLVLRALEKSAGERYQSAREFAEHIESHRAGVPLVRVHARSRPARRLRVAACAIMGALVLGVGSSARREEMGPAPLPGAAAPGVIEGGLYRLGPLLTLSGDLREHARVMQADLEAGRGRNAGPEDRRRVGRLGLVREALGEYAEAERLFERALAAETQGGIKHARVIQLVRVARCAGARGDHVKAEQRFAECEGLISSLADAPQPVCGEVLVSLARYRMSAGRLEDAQAILGRADTCCGEFAPHSHWTRWYVYSAWADYYAARHEPGLEQVWRVRAAEVLLNAPAPANVREL